ncbi:hypothetical protein E4U53_003082 [Claviceps sorghi]|nr:hypothetical protein E4U53_003082 [Claviceps sorghi]
MGPRRRHRPFLFGFLLCGVPSCAAQEPPGGIGGPRDRTARQTPPSAGLFGAQPRDAVSLPREPLRDARPGAAASTVPSTDKGPPAAAYDPVTPPPSRDAALVTLPSRQTYTCDAVDPRDHCGWRVPLARAQAVKRDSITVWIIVGCVAGVFALGLV